MPISKEQQIGKAGEHIVCADLILKGYNAFLADAGLPFDVVMEENNALKRIQVKSVSKSADVGITKNVYCFHLRRMFGKNRNNKTTEPLDANEIDYIALVALDVRQIAYIPVSKILNEGGIIKQILNLRTMEMQREMEKINSKYKSFGHKIFEDYPLPNQA